MNLFATRKRGKKRGVWTADIHFQKTENMEAVKKDKLQSGWDTNIGTRKSQQDAANVLMDTRGRLLAVLCDGMGGLEGGEIASNLCVNMVCEDFRMQEGVNYPGFWWHEVRKADDRIHALKADNGEPKGAGTTMLGVVVEENRLYWASVGDSRIYLIRGKEIVQVTRDHNFSLRLMEKVEKGLITEAEARSHPGREALISYIGMGGISLADINGKAFYLQKNDYVILCSDGLYRSVEERRMWEIVQENPDDMAVTAKKLVNEAVDLSVGSQDNTTVIIIKYID